MIDRHEMIGSFRDEVAQHLANGETPAVTPLPISPWLAMSLLQKSIRRGRRDLALSAAATLFLIDPSRLWRRLGGIAFEDVGLGSPCDVGLVASALAGKRVRFGLGGEWPVAAFLVQRLADCPKCRATDDLLMSIEASPNLQSQRNELAYLSLAKLRLVVLGDGNIFERGLALLYLAGTEARPNPHLITRPGEPAFAFDVLEEIGAPQTIIEVSREGYRRTRDALCLLLPLLSAETCGIETHVQDDALPHEGPAGCIPGWAIDGYSRDGKDAIRRFLNARCDFARWAQNTLPPGNRTGVAARLLFHAEGGLLIRRRNSPLAADLRKANEEEASGLTPDDFQTGSALIRADLATLNAIRAKLMEARNAL